MSDNLLEDYKKKKKKKKNIPNTEFCVNGKKNILVA